MPWVIPVNLMLTPGQKHDLTCARPLLENVDPGALIGDKAYDADSVDRHTQSALNHSGDPAKSQPQGEARVRLRALLRAHLVERFFNKIKHYPRHRHALRQTRSKFFSPPSSSSQLSSCSTEDRP